MRRRGRGEGSIYEVEPGKWVAAATVGYIFKHGKRQRVRKTFSATTRKEVSEKLKAAQGAQQIGVNIAPNKRTVGWFLNYWIDQVIALDPGIKPKTLKFYRYVVRIHLLPALGDIKLDKLTTVQVQAMLNHKRETISERTKRLLSPETVKGIKRTLHAALETALAYEYVQRNVAASKKRKGAGSAEQKPEARFLTLSGARSMLESARFETLYYALFISVLSLGTRLGEGLAHGWDDFDPKAGQLKVRYTLQRVERQWVRLSPKSRKSRRTIDLPDVIVAALLEHRDRQQQAREWAGTAWKGNPWDLIFTTSIGTPIDERNALRIFQDKILKRAGLPKMKIHELRHSAVAILIAQGVGPSAISALLGHSSVSFTLQVYGHLFEETKRETATKMNSVMASLLPVATSLAISDESQREKPSDVIESYGATRQDRTGDLLITNQPLYQLS